MALSPEALEADRRLAHELDAKIQVLHASELKIEAQICDLVVIIGERNLFRALKKTSLAQYTKARLGWSAGKTSSVMSLSRLLPERPNLRAAFYAGTLGWSVTYEVALDSTPESEAELTHFACEHNQDEVRVELARRKNVPVARRFTVTWSEEQLNLVNDAIALVRRQHPRESFDFNEALAKVCELLVLHAAKGSGVGAGARVLLDVCTRCKTGSVPGRSGPVLLPVTTVERFACCAETLNLTDVKNPGKVTSTVPPRIANFVDARDRETCRIPGCGNRTFLERHHEGGRANVGHDPECLFLVCSQHHQMRHDGWLEIERFGRGRYRFKDADEVLGEIDISLTDDQRRALRVGPSEARPRLPGPETRSLTFPVPEVRSPILPVPERPTRSPTRRRLSWRSVSVPRTRLGS